MLLHAPDEVPHMRDLGFSVAPGTQALVAVTKVTTDNLGEPYGTCLRDAPLGRCVSRDAKRSKSLNSANASTTTCLS